ncbi:hypothetical protein K443DRAFT_204339 [Laccaria amethystina LaAM-08-1]|uniref:Uncharacterized protein n=1 Tax=Laccaria amethystina LaAM-08-1 TaxID=1095629 RepID=A0A0C9YAP6_9AGAR|nr:hypothetical protein K443DRAFT_204339 [Laccaria amethystina LaAM-08-1]
MGWWNSEEAVPLVYRHSPKLLKAFRVISLPTTDATVRGPTGPAGPSRAGSVTYLSVGSVEQPNHLTLQVIC